MRTFKLNDGNEIPSVGFGVFMAESNGPTEEAVSNALKAGYRLIDTAAAYFNEEDVGRAIRKSGVPKDYISDNYIRIHRYAGQSGRAVAH